MTIAKLVWVDPTSRVDNTPGTPAALVINMSADGGKTFTQVGSVGPGVQAFSQDLGTDTGTFTFDVVAVDAQTPPVASDPSAPASVVVAAPPPPPLAKLNPPTNLVATLA